MGAKLVTPAGIGLLSSLLGVAVGAAASQEDAAGRSPQDARRGVAHELREAASPSSRAFGGSEDTTGLRAQLPGEGRSLACADFDEDGIPDLLAGYASKDSSLGIVTLWRGNPDAIYPNTPEARLRRAKGASVAAPFLGPPSLFVVPGPADFLAAGDFDGDGRTDALAAAIAGSDLYLVPGTGAGSLGTAEDIPLPGRITALASGEIDRRDGLPDLVVAIDGPSGPGILVFEAPEGALRRDPEWLPLAAPARAIVLDRLDEDGLLDLATVAGEDLVVFAGRDRKLSWSRETRAAVGPRSRVTQALPRPVAALASGDFLDGGSPARELVVFDREGGLTVLRRSPPGRDAPSPETWSAALRLVDPGRATGSEISGPSALRTAPGADLVVMEPAGLTIVPSGSWRLDRPRTEGAEAGHEAGAAWIEMAGSRAVLPMRLNSDALSDFVVLGSDSSPPKVVLTSTPVFVVDDNGDQSDYSAGDGHCDIDSTVDDTPCTLRAAIEEANALTGSEEIRIQIPNTTILPKVISPSSSLPDITSQVTLDGTYQVSGVVLQGSSAGAASGLTVKGGSSVIRGISIKSFQHFGIFLDSSYNVVEGNHIGLDGLSSGPNQQGGILAWGDGNTIGGSTEAARNVISSNLVTGTEMNGGVRVGENLATETADVTVEGNYIGTNIDGTAARGNERAGIYLLNTLGTLIKDNVIAATTLSDLGSQDGIYIDENSASTFVYGNFIGTNASGASGLGNGYGLRAFGGNNEIGGTSTAARNVVSGNATVGIDLVSPNNVVQGNYVGTSPAGSSALPNATGISLRSIGNLVGGTTAGAGNLVSGNTDRGILVTTPQNDGEILGNLVGTDAVGNDGGLGNGEGLLLESVSGHLRVGDGSSAGANRIAYNAGSGVRVTDGQDHRISRNEVFSNGLLGLDLVAAGQNVGAPLLNDLFDVDGGPNTLLNSPLVTSVSTAADLTTIEGTYAGHKSFSVDIELYSGPACDSSGYGEGQTYLGTVTETTDSANGTVDFQLLVTPAVPAGDYVTALALENGGYDTSEFSQCRREDATCAGPPDLVLDSTTLETIGTETFEACNSITAKDVLVAPFSFVVFRAGSHVVLEDGFEADGYFEVEIDPGLLP